MVQTPLQKQLILSETKSLFWLRVFMLGGNGLLKHWQLKPTSSRSRIGFCVTFCLGFIGNTLADKTRHPELKQRYLAR
jgi:hypothetical protein